MKRGLLKIYQNFDKMGAILAMAAMIGVTVLQIVGRLTAVHVPWTIEISRYLLIYLGFLGLSEATKTQEHIGTEFLQHWVGPKVKFYLWLFIQICFLIFSIFMVYSGIDMVKMHHLSRQFTVSLPLNFPISYVSIIIPVAFGFTSMHLIGLIRKGVLEERIEREKS